MRMEQAVTLRMDSSRAYGWTAGRSGGWSRAKGEAEAARRSDRGGGGKRKVT
jgi:hypothetical protein